MTIISWHLSAWEDYLYWEMTDKKVFLKINHLIKDTMRNPFSGLGKPEPLKGNYVGYWSKRITHEHRLVYKVLSDQLMIAACRFHY